MKNSKSLLIAALALGIAGQCAADSLYVPGKSKSMFADRKARAAGDVLTVLITETTTAVQDADSELARSTSASAGGGTGGFFNVLRLIPKATLSGSTKQEGKGSTARTSKVISTITCKVVNVTEGGMLVVRGERHLKTNKDVQTVTFHGIVRPEDVDPANTVLSTQVADARIEITGKGPIDRHIRPGILSRIFEILF
jgi:flagellar L-ring protein FlgH